MMSGFSRFLAGVVFAFLAGDLAAAPPAVLIIYSNDRLLPANVALDGAFRKTLEGSGDGVEIFSEFLGAPRFLGPENEESFAGYLTARYESSRTAVVVAVGAPALDFLLRHDDLFQGTHLVAAGCSSEELQTLRAGAGFAAVPLDLRVDATFTAITRLHPEADRIFIIAGSSAQDQAFERIARQQLGASAGDRQIEYLSGLSIAELERRLTAPESSKTVGIFLSYLLDDEGGVHFPVDVATRLSTISKIPIYGTFDSLLGSGIVGGAVIPFGTHASETARIVRRLLDGESVETIGVTAPTTAVLELDDRQVRKWQIRRARIPRDAELRFASPSPWDVYRREILLGAGLIVVQALLIAVLVFEQRRRRRAERRASSEARRLRLITDSLPALIAQIDAEGRYVFVNEAYRKWWHIDPTSAPGRTIEAVVGTEVWELVRSHVKRVLAGERVQYGMQTRLADGSTRDIEALYVPDIDSEGTVNGFYSLVLDVTEEKRAERENLVLQTELAHASRMSTMGELAAALAHELNQPLTAIMSNAQAAQRFVDRETPDLDEVRSILSDIVDDDRRASEVIRRLREFLRKGTVEMKPLGLNDVVREVVGIMGEKIRSESVSLSLDLDESIARVSGDRIQLQQVVLNLVSNAVEAMSDGELADRRLLIATSMIGHDEVSLSVADSGPGIGPELLRKVFEPFYTTKAEGMGLGLPLCRTLVEAHGGRINAGNREGAGAEIVLRFPAIEPQ